MEMRLIKKAADLICRSEIIVAFTGAGVSTESGIPDFRSPGGIWEKYQPVYYDDFLSSEAARLAFWQRSRATYPAIRDAKPNPTHLALYELERMGKLEAIITQNIDRLHHKAGSSPEKIIEIHGTTAYAVCLDCKKTYDRDVLQRQLEIKEEVDVPYCPECHGPLKDATISFGQPMPEQEMAVAGQKAQLCDLMILLGSSLVVYPAAYLPQHAHQSGAHLIIINLDPTPFDHLAAVAIHARTGEALPQIVAQVRQQLEG
ncbi:MAG TPA: Sir2 family NAD-dependent protein deacetylase [Syntrophales bacterium]|nr:Sir2 family NAD-dependent protein deacetylase [Syntrophales bacterium]